MRRAFTRRTYQSSLSAESTNHMKHASTTVHSSISDSMRVYRQLLKTRHFDIANLLVNASAVCPIFRSDTDVKTCDTAHETGPTSAANTLVAASGCTQRMFVAGRRGARLLVGQRSVAVRHDTAWMRLMRCTQQTDAGSFCAATSSSAYVYAGCSRCRISYPRWRIHAVTSIYVRPTVPSSLRYLQTG